MTDRPTRRAEGGAPHPTGHERTGTLLGIATELTEISLTIDDFEALFTGIETVVRRTLGHVDVGIDLFMADGDYLQLLPGSFGAPTQITRSSQVDVGDPLALSARVMRSGDGLIVLDATAAVPQLADWYAVLGIRQLMSVALPGGGRQVGVLHVANPESAFDEADLTLLEQISPFVAAAIEHAVRRIVMARNERLTTVLNDIAREVITGRSLVDLAQVELPEFCAASNTNVLAISFTGEEHPRVVLRHGAVDDAIFEGFLRESKTPRDRISLRRERSSGIGVIGVSRAHLPVIVSGEHQASLSLLRRPGSPFSADELKVIHRLGSVVALSWTAESYRREFGLRARADERHRIADELHDDVAQILFSVELALTSMVEVLAEPGAAPQTVRATAIHARDLLIRGEVSLRDRMKGLAAVGSGGLRERLDSIAHDVEDEFGVAIKVAATAESERQSAGLSPAVSGVVLRAVREGLVNAAKHAQPCRIDLTACLAPHESDDRPESLILMVQDDGVDDFDPETAGHGLAAVRRMLGDIGGALRLDREAGSVTRYEVRVPLLES